MEKFKFVAQKSKQKHKQRNNQTKKDVKIQPYKPEPKPRNPDTGPKIKIK